MIRIRKTTRVHRGAYRRALALSSMACLALPLCAEDSAAQREIVRAASDKALQAMQGLQKNGGWAVAWAADGSATFGEWLLREDDIITIQPPGTPALGSIFLRAHVVLGDPAYLDAAIQAGDALREGQFEHGGFPQEFYPGRFSQDPGWFEHYGVNGEPWYPPEVEGADIYIASNGSGTFDDRTTQAAALFLLELWQATGEARFEAAAKKAAEFMLQAQYPNGGWPQKFPLQDNYTRFITLNDGAMPDVIRTLITFADVLHDRRYREAAIRGVDYLLEVQARSAHPGWAQQYDIEGKPQGARPWEPAALSALESVNVIEFLLEAYQMTGDRKYLVAGMAAVRWLQQSRLESGGWARFYELETNRPIFAGRDNQRTYNVNEALEHHTGYNWRGNYLRPALVRRYEVLLGSDAGEGMDPPPEADEEASSDPAVLSILSRRNADGLWTRPMTGERLRFYQAKYGPQGEPPELIDAGRFVSHLRVLLGYLEASSGP